MGRRKQVSNACTSRDHKPRQKRARNQEGDGEGDRISNLPECLLSNIMSRLPTKDAVRTSVLSKKWEYIWTCIYNLDLNDRSKIHPRRRTRKDRFSFFVDRVLMLGAGSLRSFILRCSSCSYEPSRISAWISAALRRNVQILDIHIWSGPLVLPHSIYDSNSLRELKLLSWVTIKFPNETLFSKLRKIEFDQVIIENQDLSANNGQLLLKFPLLESLSMFRCTWRNVKAVKLDAPLLTSFHVSYPSHEHYGDKKEGFVFEICGSKLADFKSDSEVIIENYVLPKPSPVETAKIKLFLRKGEWIPNGFRIAKVLRQMNALKYLELSSEVLVALGHAAQIGSLPLFVNLSHLKLYTTFHVLMDGAMVIGLMQRAPVLQMLTMDVRAAIWKGLLYDGSSTEGDGNNNIPACFSSHLKVAKIVYGFNCFDCFNEEKDLIGLIKFILKNSRVLEEFQLIRHDRIIPMPTPHIRKLLLSYPRASNVAQIVFS